MSCRKWMASAILVAGMTAAFGSAQAADEKKMEQGGMDPKMMEEMMALAAPGEAHKHFDRFVGDWKATIKMWMGPEPTTSTGSVHFEKVLGGRYLMGIHKGDFAGMPFEGHSLDGYDNHKKEYFSLWIDNMGTGYMQMKGSVSDDGKTATYSGTMYEPMVGKDCTMKEVLKWTSPTSYTFEMYSNASGKEEKSMEITYTR